MESEGTTVKLVAVYLLMLIKFLNRVLFKFQCFLVDRFLQNSPSDNPVSEKYRALRVDAMPIIEKRELLDYRQLLSKYLKERGKPLKPVNRRSKYLPPLGTICPICNAPMSISMITQAVGASLAVRCVSLLSILIRLIWKSLRLNAPIVAELFRKSVIASSSLFIHVLIGAALLCAQFDFHVKG